MSRDQDPLGLNNDIGAPLSSTELEGSPSLRTTLFSSSRASIYRALSGSEIRLIRLRPGDWDDPIICDLIYLPLDDRPKFMALSYAWGDPTRTRPITLDGQPYNITTNLFRALRRLRYMLIKAGEMPETFLTESIDSFHLWADAICINQNNDEEKTSQISRMRDIYSLAGRVCAWLGENEENDRKIIYQIMGMAHCLGLESRMWTEYLSELFDNSDPLFESFGNGLIELSSRQWWSRIWVIQEVCLASTTPILLAGGAWSYMGSFVKLVEIVIHHSKALKMLGIISCLPLLSAIFVSEIREDYGKAQTPGALLGKNKANLGAILEKVIGKTINTCTATLPHDYLYGFLGLLGSGPLPHPLLPDYSKPFPRVYQEYTRFIIEQTSSLSILLRHKSGITGFPSWVPDFRSDGLLWTETTDAPQPIFFSEDGSRMTVLGTELGVCKSTFVPLLRVRPDPPTQAMFLDSMYQFDKFILEVSILRSISKDQALVDWLESRRGDRVVDPSTRDLKEFYLSTIRESDEVPGRQTSRAREIIQNRLTEFTTFVTESGHVASLYRYGRDAKSGDVMVAVRGSDFPFLLRPAQREGEYEYLGFCKPKLECNEESFSSKGLCQFVIV